MKEKIPVLKEIYRSFEEKTLALKQGQACTRGCGFCCKEAGRIDITTLEGLRIRAAMEKLPKARQKTLTRLFRQEIKLRENNKTVACPFLMKNNACMIYEARPFSCRRIYSVHVCSKDHPPRVSQKVMALADETIKELQTLDHTGYSGHLSYILYMLSVPAFRETYLKGEFKPEQIMEFGKSHGIIINRG
ncbi:MAG: YkgJ family cysteine cluster protein [Desulfobacter sp.]|nr:YkgJ family cysteine cluster protein [Desulfobacter sp.]WDP84170.1 MAG: YkgJ family cysteine cluster protein [Desulfobacter sp.]